MNISSTPFIRNDYWPDQNDINELNKRIDEAENETSLVNSRLSNDIENVSANLNSYISNQANTTIANNIIVNSLNANYATGKFANFTNTFTNNAYVENLTVNKPVFDITLNTPHIENVTSLGGNIYDANIFNVSITGGNVAFNSVSIDDLTAENATISDVNIQSGHAILNTINVDTLKVNNPVSDITLNAPNIENVTSLGGNISDANILNVSIVGGNATFNSINTESLAAVNATISNVNILDGDVNLNKAIINNVNASNATILNLFVNTQPEPITSSAVLGYDSEGRVIPIHASYDVGFPGDANYLFTDHAGTAFAGTAATAVDVTNNLITSFAVKNAIDIVNESFNSVNNALNDIGSWQNTFENSVANSFNNVNNTFNGVNNSFNNVNNSFNSVNTKFNNVNNTFNNVNNVISNVNNTAVNANTLASSLSSALVGNAIPYNSNSLLDYRNVEHIAFVTPANEGYVSEMTITFPPQTLPITASDSRVYRVTNSTNRVVTLSGNANGTFQPVTASIAMQERTVDPELGIISWGASKSYVPSISGNNLVLTSTDNTIRLPLNDSQIYVSRKYTRISVSIENTAIPVFINFNTSTNTLTYSSNIDIDNNYSRLYNTDMNSLFNGCTRFNQPINIPNGTMFTTYMFNGCTNFNQSINIPSSVIAMESMLYGCTHFNQNDIYIHAVSNSPLFFFHAFNSVSRIGNIHIPASVPKATSNIMYNCLVNGWSGYTFAAANIKNDL